MTDTSPKQLNAFEIKREISRIVKALEDSTILVDTAEFKTLDEQEDKAGILKILLKEFSLCNEDTMPVIKLLLLRYTEKPELLEILEDIIKNPDNDNNLKLHAIEIISSFKPDWHEENYDSYLDYDEELIQKETKELLECSNDNPEIQLDFLDFFSAIPKKDQITLLESLAEDQYRGDLANILVPIFLSYPQDEIGLCALKLLGNSKSPFAYHSLKEVFEHLDDKTKQNVKKTLSELKLSGANKDFEQENLNKETKFYLIPPDGEGNFSLIYVHKNEDGTIRLIGIAADDYYGIRECLGFSAISEFEAKFLLEKLSGADFKTLIKPEVFKQLLLGAEMLNYKKSAPPYEYNCWKKIFLGIAPENIDFEEYLTKELEGYEIKDSDITDVLSASLTDAWFYSKNFGDETEIFFKELDKRLSQTPINEVDFEEFIQNNLDLVFYDEEKENWTRRLLLTAYGKHCQNDEKTAKSLYELAIDETLKRELFKFILKQSIFQYFLKLITDNNFNKYDEKELEDILSYLENLWGFYV